MDLEDAGTGVAGVESLLEYELGVVPTVNLLLCVNGDDVGYEEGVFVAVSADALPEFKDERTELAPDGTVIV